MSKQKVVSLYEFFQRFPDEESARLYFESKRWKDGAFCGHCASVNIVEVKDHKPMPYRCRDCRGHFSVRTGTVLAESRLPLLKWLMAIYMMTTARKGIPSTQMARELGITQKSSWFLAQRIRETWVDDTEPLGDNPVEADETFVGGKERNKHTSKRHKSGTGWVGKQVVFGMLERGKKVRAMIIDSPTRVILTAAIHENIKKGAIVYTDAHHGYDLIDSEYKHARVNHGVREYVNGMAHTNGIESFWALLKRGYYGVYHHMSPQHLHRYVQEFSFRHNTAHLDTMEFIEQTIDRMVGRRLTYRELTNGA